MPDAVWPRAWFRAVNAGAQGPGPRRIVRQASHTIFDIYMAVLPAAMTIEFLALVVITYTEWLTWLSLPMYPLLWLLQLPDAWAVLPGTFWSASSTNLSPRSSRRILPTPFRALCLRACPLPS